MGDPAQAQCGGRHAGLKACKIHFGAPRNGLPVRRDREILWGGRRGNGNFVAACNRWSAAMPQPNDLSRSLVALDQNTTIIAVVELSQSSWLIGGIVPGIERQPHKKLEPSPERLLAVLHRWRDEAVRAGRTITRIAVAFEAGRPDRWCRRFPPVRLGRVARPIASSYRGDTE